MAVAYLNKHTVDPILLDMPLEGGINDLETYKQILQTHPGQRATTTTDYSETESAREAMRPGAGQYMKRPYLFGEIAQAIKTELKTSNTLHSSYADCIIH